MSFRVMVLQLLLVGTREMQLPQERLQEKTFDGRNSSTSPPLLPLCLSSDSTWYTFYDRTHAQLSAQLPRQWENLYQQWLHRDAFIECPRGHHSDRLHHPPARDAHPEHSDMRRRNCDARKKDSLPLSRFPQAVRLWKAYVEAEEVWTVAFLYGTSRVGRAQWHRYCHPPPPQGKRGSRETKRHTMEWHPHTRTSRDGACPGTSIQMTSMPAGRGASWSSSAPHEREGGVVGRHLLPLSETFLSASASSSLTYRLPSAGRKGKKTKRAEERKKRGGRREKEDGLNTLPFAVPLFMEVEEEEEKNTKIVSGEQVGQGSTRWIREKEKSRTMADAWQALDWLQHIVKREEYGVESIDTKWKEPKRSMDGEGEDEGEERGGPMPSSSAVSSSLRTTLRWGKSAYAVLSVLDEIMCFGDVQHGRAPLVEEKGKKMAVARASLSHPPPPPHLPVPNRSERSGGGAERHCGSSLVALAERNAPVSYCCSLPLQLYGMYFYGSADLLPSSLRAESFFRMQREEEEEVGKRKKMGGKPVREGVMSPAWLEGKGNEMEVDDNLPAYTNDPSCEKRRLPSTTTTPTAFFWRRVKGRHAVQNAFWKDHNSPVGLPHLPPSPSLTNGGIQSHSLSAASFSSSTSFQWASHVLSRWIRSSGDEFCALPPSFRYRPVPSPPPSSSSLLVLAEGRSFPTPWPPSSSSVFDAYWTQLFFIYESMMVESVAIAAGAAAAAAASMFPSSSPHPDLLRHNASDEEGKDFVHSGGMPFDRM